ncbi:rhythmically expressed gene 2 protein [Drosophila innubila]|uniref:rhythmically expressed gene 2 protein n=1 Tax=Drosophila innubila TaxID=198719 RepID=UPI00148DCA69|nr:rhythmically expressed gene 2 protein [Drosophila innubila]
MPLTAQFVRNLQRFRLVTFDVTDTLLRLKDPTTQYIQTAAANGVASLDRTKMELCFRQQFKWMSKKHKNYGRNTPNMEWQSWWLQLVAKTFNCVDANIPQDKLQIIAEQLLSLFRTSACWTHINCAAELVQCVRQAGKCVGVISNFDPSLPQVLSAMGFDKKFDFILTSYEAGVMKPDPGIFQIPVKRLQIAPSEALHIGNKFDLDYLGARNSGWSSLLVQSQPDPKLDTSSAAKYSFPSLAKMLQTLESQEFAW